MGEINAPNPSSKKHGRLKKLSTRVDLTPMVDLGFLLITFFIFTTTMGEKKSVKLSLPQGRPGDSSITAEGKTISLILGPRNTVWYYPGTDRLHSRHSSSRSFVRELIIEEKKRVAQIYGNPKELVILLKPTVDCRYQDLVAMLDEMVINNVPRYVFMEPDQGEIRLAAN